MDMYEIYINGIQRNSVEASSYGEAFVKCLREGYIHKEVSKDDMYDVEICNHGDSKYFWVRFG